VPLPLNMPFKTIIKDTNNDLHLKMFCLHLNTFICICDIVELQSIFIPCGRVEMYANRQTSLC
jgi:hypothetical protein